MFDRNRLTLVGMAALGLGVALRLALPPGTALPEGATTPQRESSTGHEPAGASRMRAAIVRADLGPLPSWPPVRSDELDLVAHAAEAGDAAAAVGLYREVLTCANSAGMAWELRQLDELSNMALDDRNFKEEATPAQIEAALAQLQGAQAAVRPTRERLARCRAIGPEQQSAAFAFLAAAAAEGDRTAQLCLVARSSEAMSRFALHADALRIVRDHGWNMAQGLLESGSWPVVLVLARAYDTSSAHFMRASMDGSLMRMMVAPHAALAYRYHALARLGGALAMLDPTNLRMAQLEAQLRPDEIEAARQWADRAFRETFGARAADLTPIDACGPPPSAMRDQY